MIDPFTAFAAAQAAVRGIQAAIKLGKDVQGIASDLSKFFEAKDIVQQAANNPKKFKSDTAQALETVMQAKQLVEAETELKNALIWSGNADVWEGVLLERNNIIQRRKKAEMDAALAKAKKRQQIMEAVSMVFWISIFLVAIGLSYFFTTLFLERRA
jgi:ABC-type antimicrobial peptide transport system permease subunit